MSKRGADAFYVGYQKQADPVLAKVLKGKIILIIALCLAVGGVVAALQATFGPVIFEFGKIRSFAGVIQEQPYPALRLDRPGQTGDLSAASHYLLVSEFKFGAQEAVQGLEGRAVHLKGSLIYRDGRTMIELVPGSVEPGTSAPAAVPSAENLGVHTFRGEIVDSKCYLGVMNPGHLKTHKACAIRCISGGIPPVLLVRDESGLAQYLLLVDAVGQSVNQAVLDRIAEPVEITGTVERHGTMLVLKADPATYQRR